MLKKTRKLNIQSINFIVIIILLGGSLAWLVSGRLSETEPAPPVVSQVITATLTPSLDLNPPVPLNIWAEATLDDIEFGPAQVVLTDTQPLRLIQWISNEEFLLIQGVNSKETIEIYNAHTGEINPLVTADVVGYPLWSVAKQEVLYRTYDYRTERRPLWTKGVEGKAPRLLYKDIDHPILLGGKRGEGIGWQPEEGNLVYVTEKGAEATPLAFDFSPYMPPKLTGRDIGYRVTPSPTGEWQAVYNSQYFFLMDVDEGVIEEIPLPGQVLGVTSPPEKTWGLLAVWSPDGRKIGIIATTGEVPIDYLWLYIYNMQTKEIVELEMPSDVFFSNLAWAPNNRFLLVQGREGLGQNGSAPQKVWLFDITTGQRESKNMLPFHVTGGFMGEELIWSPDGQLMAFNCHLAGADDWRTCISDVRVQ